LLKTYSPNAIRQFLLSAHYRSPLDLRNDSLDEASSAVERILNCVSMTARLSTQERTDFDNPQGAEQDLNISIDDAIRKFDESMDDDFNTPGAFGAIFELVAIVNKFTSENQSLSARGKDVLGRVNATLVKLCGVLGLDVTKDRTSEKEGSLVDDLIKLIIEVRQYAREKKDWTAADKIRDGLANLGIKLEDTREGTIWKITSKT
jgi:cysteinyl-tRNA synthetase